MFDASFFTDPYPLYKRLRAGGAIHFAPGTGKSGGWIVPGYDDAADVLSDLSLSSARSGVSFAPYLPEERSQLQRIQEIFAESMMFLDPPAHTMWRRIMLKAFTRAHMGELKPVTTVFAQQLLDAAEDKAQFDFIADYANLLPIYVVAHLLGADVDDHRQFTTWARDISAFVSTLGPSLDLARRAQDATLALYEHLRQAIARRLKSPLDDAISAMIRETHELGLDAAALDHALHVTLPAHCVGLLVAGHETSSNLIGNAMNIVFRRPELLARLVAEPALCHTAAGEFARFDSSVQILVRLTMAPGKLLGQDVHPGQVVMALVGSANRDERKFERPDVFDMHRTERSLTFGSGRHYCPGTQMGLMELGIALEQVFLRFPKLALVGTPDELVWRPSVNFRGIVAMPVTTN
ncbi:cytochrome P450 [soil metagenome]